MNKKVNSQNNYICNAIEFTIFYENKVSDGLPKKTQTTSQRVLCLKV